MSDSVYIGIEGNVKPIFRQIVNNCNLADIFVDELTGDTVSNMIKIKHFNEILTANGETLIEIPCNPQVCEWQDILLEYIQNSLPPGLVNKVTYYTRKGAIVNLKREIKSHAKSK